MGYSRGGGSEEGACLIFAHNGKEAKKLAFEELSGWCSDQEWIDVAVNRIRKYFIYKSADQELLAKGIPHIADNPACCKQCEMWGSELDENGICESCKEFKES